MPPVTRWSSNCSPMRRTRWPRQSGLRWKIRSVAWPSMTPPMRVSSRCTLPSARPRKPPRGLRPLPRSVPGAGARRRELAAAADAAHAAVDLGILPPHLLDGLQLLAGGGRLRLALRRQFRFLLGVTRLPLGLGLEEAAILLDGERRGGADEQAKCQGEKQLHGRGAFPRQSLSDCCRIQGIVWP